MKEQELTSRIIKAFYRVYNALGYGFLEKVYENSLMIELENMGFTVESQRAIDVYYRGKIVGNNFADLVVEDKVILEIKSAESIAESHESQIVNYLKASNIEVGLILNFGKSAILKRKVFSNNKRLSTDILLNS